MRSSDPSVPHINNTASQTAALSAVGRAVSFIIHLQLSTKLAHFFHAQYAEYLLSFIKVTILGMSPLPRRAPDIEEVQAHTLCVSPNIAKVETHTLFLTSSIDIWRNTNRKGCEMCVKMTIFALPSSL